MTTTTATGHERTVNIDGLYACECGVFPFRDCPEGVRVLMEWSAQFPVVGDIDTPVNCPGGIWYDTGAVHEQDCQVC